MKHGIAFLCFFSFFAAGAQSISSSIISTSGESHTNSQLSASWTLGEPITGLMTSSDNQLSNGYHSQYSIETLSVRVPDVKASILIYPNPATEYLMINNSSGNEETILTIYTQSGQEVINKHLNEAETKIDVRDLSVGVYIIKISSNNQLKSNTYKLIKK